MLRRPALRDYNVIGYYTGRVVIGLGVTMLIPIVVGILSEEWNSVLDFSSGLGASLTVGYGLVLLCAGAGEIKWIHGLVVSALSWLVCMVLAAIPYYLSGYYLSFLDCVFDVMSGMTTTGLTLIQDLDHVPVSLNTWRHMLSYIGGQGMVVLALTFLIQNQPGAVSVYVGEGKDEKLLPNVFHTARAIWMISLVWLVLGTLALWASGIAIGLGPLRALLHGLWIFMAAWSTGGFAPQTQNILYYHSFLYEVVTVIIMVIGSFNFALHYAVWTGNRREAYRNIEVVSFAVTSTVLFLVVASGLMGAGVYPDWIAMLRKGYYLLVSGHTTTGFMAVYARQFILEWGDIALFALIVAMLIGGSACSTAGGFKGIRIGLIARALVQDIRRMMVPSSAVVVDKFHHIKDIVVDDKQVRTAMTIVILYGITFGIGTLAGVWAGFPIADAAFESASVTGNVGLSCGVTSPSIPAFQKIVYIGAMWAGRLEFVSILGMTSFLVAVVRGR